MMNGSFPAVLVALLAYSASGLVPEAFAPQALAITVAVLSFAVMDLRREWRAAHRQMNRQAQAVQYLLGAVSMISPRVNVSLPPFKWPED